MVRNPTRGAANDPVAAKPERKNAAPDAAKPNACKLPQRIAKNHPLP
ncbi:hypothetical protein RMSM_03053 [Rhodopirellula maiorica SM1]|uniref:Uncharacterized protein n=1 Tax=Rhodopirellula maiorica SM1 TaxID=1265738 RepID=M5S1G4_9BACT|nr:hypothetical protein RMSM_03053 [Rhodopirellula maiorica SM1]